MICDICGENEAIVHVQQIMGGEIYEVHMCAECAKQKGVALENGENGEVSLSQLLSGLVESFSQEGEHTVTNECPKCGTTLTDLKENETAGCAECYTTFRNQIDTILADHTDITIHRGKFPEKLKAYKAILIDKEVLKRKLSEAVQREEYERAALLRDQIQELEQNPHKGIEE